MAITLDYGRQPAGEGPVPWLWAIAAFVVVFLGLSCVVPRFHSRDVRERQARQSAAAADMKVLRDALDAFNADAGRYPTGAEGLGALVQASSTFPNWHGPYLVRGSHPDPWGSAYVYTPPTGVLPPKVCSAGPDRISGTADDIASR